MKNKKIWTGLLSCLTALAMSLPVHAETFYGDDSWSVVFNGRLVSSFSTADINDVAGGMQPGDNVIVTLRLKNENPTATDWYMQNEVLYSWRTGAPTARPAAARIPIGSLIQIIPERCRLCSTATR